MEIPKEAIESSFGAMVRENEAKKMRSKQTQKKCVLEFFLDYSEKIWWWPWELIGKTTMSGRYLSHRAPARASDLAIHFPDLVEHRKIGRFKVYRIRLENISLIEEYIENKQTD